MTRKEVYGLCKKYLGGHTSLIEDKYVEEQIVNKLDASNKSFSEVELSEIEERMWSNIQMKKQPKYNIIQLIKNASAIAAVFLFVYFMIGFGNNSKTSFQDLSNVFQSSNQVEITNNTEDNKEVKLEDGTQVILKKNSSISYSANFNVEKREVNLKGEAFFHVKRDPTKPFYVYAHNLVTKVLGTSFIVKAYQSDKNVTVQVKTGKVTVYHNNIGKNQDPEVKGLIITPNQKATYSKNEESLERTLIDKPTLISPEDVLEDYSYKSTPITKIFSELEKAYGIDIVFNDSEFTNCNITTNLTDQSLFDKLDVICLAIESSYKVVDAQIIIEGSGCK
jgi:transmembrane sensor